MSRKGLALILTLSMILSMCQVSVYGINFTDMPNNWSTEALERAVENGLLKGNDGKIKGEDSLTRAEMATIINRAFNTEAKASLVKFSDVLKDKWYYEDMEKAVQMGTFVGSGNKLNPEQKITREEAFVVMARAFKIADAKTGELNKFSDAKDISDWAQNEISSLVSAGYIAGSDGKIHPKQEITRAEFAKIMDNLVKTYVHNEGEYTKDYQGNVMINNAGVTLKGITITGDLIIGDGVGDGEVILDNVTLTGRMVVRGGGENSIKIIGNTNIKNIIIARVDGIVRVYTEKGIEIGEVTVDGTDDVILDGDFKSVTLTSKDVTVMAKNSKIESALVLGENSKIIVDKDSTLEKITVNAKDVKIEGKGIVKEVAANADRVTVTVIGTKVTASEERQGVMAGDKNVGKVKLK